MVEIGSAQLDLLDACEVVVLATVGADGFPHTSAVWFTHEPNGTIKMALHPDRQKTKNLQRRPECSLLFVDPANAYRTLEIRARATFEPDPDYLYAAKIDAKYRSDLRSMDRPGDVRVVATFAPLRVNTFSGNWPPASTARPGS
jgi:PPOX class probable F420-dependent enzyme